MELWKMKCSCCDDFRNLTAARRLALVSLGGKNFFLNVRLKLSELRCHLGRGSYRTRSPILGILLHSDTCRTEFATMFYMFNILDIYLLLVLQL